MPKVLVLDDDIDILNIVEFIMRDAGYDVFTMSSALGFHDKVKDYKPNVVLLDITLPNYDGRILCSEMKADDAVKHIPVVLFSAMHKEEIVLKDCTPDGFLAKPFDIAGLIQIIEKHVSN